MLFNLFFANNTVLSYLFFFFVIIDFYALIPAVIAQIFNPTAELVLAIEIPTKEAKAETETHPEITEAKISICSIYSKAIQASLCFLLIRSFWLISSKK